GKIVGSERVVMRKTAQIRGTLIAPRVMLEDGARFNGTIDMDPEADAIKSAFAGQSSKPAPPQAQPATAGAPRSGGSSPGSAERS
ncbi:MAG: hypothetical protein ACOCVP_08455, partial [Wenzhouxiangella sp.]